MWIPECGKFLLTESGIRESRALEARVQLKESGSSDKYWNPVPGSQNPRLSWIPLHAASGSLNKV